MSVYLMPQPRNMVIAEEGISFDAHTLHAQVLCPQEDNRLLSCAQSLLGSAQMQTAAGDYRLCAGDAIDTPDAPDHPEGYALATKAQSVCIRARTAHGLFYGMQTLRQLIEADSFAAVTIIDWPDIPLRSDYLDLRSIYPTFERLLHFMKEMAAYKFNTVFIEYENKIPFPTMSKLVSPQAMTQAQFDLLKMTAHDHFLNIIPVQQSFGHLEYVLTLPEYRHLRETPDTPGEMCPLRPGALELSKALLSENAAMHPDEPYLSMGCDEVWSLGQSEECQNSGMSREEIALRFINQIADHVCSLGKTPIIWHDMLQSASQELLSQLDKRILVAVWMYNHRWVVEQAAPMLDRLDTAGISYIVCPAARSFESRPWQSYPSASGRMRNIDAWIRLCRLHPAKGFLNTNWAASFSFGRPYGLFETSRYTSLYSACRSWNMDASMTDYLERYLAVYHGVSYNTEGLDEYRRFDYSETVGSLLDQVKRNKESAELFALGDAYDIAAPVLCSAFRGTLNAGSEVELACLRERAARDFVQMDSVLARMQQVVTPLLPPDMCRLYMASREYPYAILRDDLSRILSIQSDSEKQ